MKNKTIIQKMFDNTSEYDFYYDPDHNKYYKNDIESLYYANIKPKNIPRKSSYSLKDIVCVESITNNEKPNNDENDDMNEKKEKQSPYKTFILFSTLIVANIIYYYFVFVFT